MHEALLYQRLAGSVVRCDTCQWRCRIHPGKLGVCKMYRNDEGRLYNLNYARVSSLAVDPIEKKPLFHFHPGTMVFSMGSWGCNFHCSGCQNWEIACPEKPDQWQTSREIPPEAAVEMARSSGAAGIAWTYNEPGIWLEYTLDTAKLARQSNLYTVYVTNGYSTPEALDTIGPYLDAWRVDIKGFSDALYNKLARVSQWRGILEVAKRAREKWQMHVEVVTNIIPGLNDDDEQLGGIAGWIAAELGELTPWHVTRFYPHRLMAGIPPTPMATLEHAYDIGRKAGLKFIYLGNVPGHKSEATVCPACGGTVVERVGYQTSIAGLDTSRCRFCGAELNIRSGVGEIKK
ncbi:MAG: AmmeMemoRadiSam system radical SAM enzyme [Dehalococcoidales bacterium]